MTLPVFNFDPKKFYTFYRLHPDSPRIPEFLEYIDEDSLLNWNPDMNKCKGYWSGNSINKRMPNAVDEAIQNGYQVFMTEFPENFHNDVYGEQPVTMELLNKP